MNKLFSLLFIVAIAASIYYFIMPQPFPSSVINNTDKGDKFSHLINSKHNAIFWSSGNDAISQDRDAEMRDLMHYNHFDRSFLYISDISDDNITCRNGTNKCIAAWIRKKCSNKYCIYIAATKKVHRINFKDKDKWLKILEQNQKK